MHQDATWYEGRPQPRRLCVRWEPSSPPQEGGGVPLFSSMSIVANRLDGSRWYYAWGWASVQATLCYMRTQLCSPKRRQSPQLSAHFYCGQTSGWIKKPLATEVGIGPVDIVLDGDPCSCPRKKRAQPPTFGPCLL